METVTIQFSPAMCVRCGLAESAGGQRTNGELLESGKE